MGKLFRLDSPFMQGLTMLLKKPFRRLEDLSVSGTTADEEKNRK